MSPVRLAILGYGHVGTALARAAVRAGHDVTFAVNPVNPDGAAAARAGDPALAAVGVDDAATAVSGADVTVLAVPFAATGPVLAPLAGILDGRVLVDATNPVGPGLTHGLGSRQAGAQHVAGLAPGARVVKAFSVYGYENLDRPPAGPGGLRAAMPYAGDDAVAKEVVAGLVGDLGWEPLDVGPLAAAVDLEHLTLLWVRMVRAGGHDSRLVWAALRDGAA